MFGKELNRSNNCYISQVAMIESKCEKADGSFRKKVNMPATVFTRSPLKDRQNKSIVGNTPSRKNPNTMSRVTQGDQDQSRRTSVSPLKNRRQANMQAPNLTEPDPSGSYSSARILVPQLSGSINSHVSKSKKVDVCQNHLNKQAKYVISIDDEDMPYCEKCAILLASQGFKVSKCDETSSSSMMAAGPSISASNVSLLDDNNHPRRQELGSFLGDLETVMQVLGNKKNELEGTIAKSESSFQQQITSLGSYYNQIIEDITSHRKAVETALIEQKSQAMGSINATLDNVNEAISDSRMMKDDIMSSLDLIKEAEEKDYRPIMESYKENARKFKSASTKTPIQPINLSSLYLSDPSEAVQTFLNTLSALLTGQEAKVPNSNLKGQSSHSSINFSFEGRTKQEEYNRQQHYIPTTTGSKILPGPISEDENPVQLLSDEDLSRQKFMKSSLKDANGLFTQFDDFAV